MLTLEFKRKTLNTCEVTIKFLEKEPIKVEGTLSSCLRVVEEILALVPPEEGRL